MFNYLLTIIVLGLIAIVIFIYLPVFGVDNNVLMAKIFDGHFLNSSSMNDRYAAWQEALNEINQSGLAGRIFGVGMGAEITIRSLYIKIYYSLGLAGLLLSVVLIAVIMHHVTKAEDRKAFYLMYWE